MKTEVIELIPLLTIDYFYAISVISLPALFFASDVFLGTDYIPEWPEEKMDALRETGETK